MRKGTCKQFNGFWGPGMSDGHKCESGVEYRSLVGGDDQGWVKRAPCFERHETDVKCDKFELPTEEEIAEYEKAWEKRFEEMKLAINLMPGLKKKHPQGGNGMIDCPVCSNKLHYSVSSFNRHVHMTCEKDGCVCIIE